MMSDKQRIDEAVAAFRQQPDVLPLTGTVRHYEWGGYHFIPDLLGEANPDNEPCAELWIGAHPSAPSEARLDGVTMALDALQEAAPEALLGPEACRRFQNRLPYLFKVLDARQMLSIQAHPTKEQAEEGYRRENEAGVSPSDPKRNYKDDNHKPEVHVVLTDFWMLHGFRPLHEIVAIADPEDPNAAGELHALLAPVYDSAIAPALQDASREGDALRAIYERAMTMPQEEADAILNPLIARLEREQPTDKGRPHYWARRAAQEFPMPDGHRDRGLFSVYLLNLIALKPGQGTYQPAGCLHAYLEGVNMELMANSDNVLRGGLTPKHVDVPELMRILNFSSGRPEILTGDAKSETETVYRTPATEFELSRIALDAGARHGQAAGHGPDALIVLEGKARIASEGQSMLVRRGEIVFVPDSVGYSIEAEDGPATLYRSATPPA